MRHATIIAVIVLLVAILGACGGDEDGGESPQSASPGTQATATATAETTQQPATPTTEGAADCEITFAGEIPSNPSGYRIYCVNADGSNLHPLTNKPASSFSGDPYEAFPAWSPSGSQVAFTRHGPDAGIYIVNADGSSERLIADGWALDIAWSPDGSQLAFSWLEDGWSPDTDAPLQLLVINADGTDLRILSDHPDLDGAEVSNFRPAWSPDGDRLLFQHLGTRTSDLYIIRADGSDLQKVDTGGLDVFYGTPDITWLPAGDALVVRGTAADEPNAPALFHLPLDSGAAERLTPENLPPLGGLVSLSPDGSRISYASSAEISDGEMDLDLYIVDIETGSAQRVTGTPDDLEASPFWSPDGNRLLYLTVPSGDESDESGHLQNLSATVINTDGTDAAIVIERFSMREALSSSPIWRPAPE